MLKSRVAMLSLLIVIISLNEVVAKDLKRLWSYGLTSRRTNTPLISENGEHNIYGSLFAYGYSIVIDGKGRRLHPSGRPLEGGEQLLRTSNYQNDPNIRAHAQVVLIMAPIRDALLYHLEGLSYDKWKKLTRPLTLNGIKITQAPNLNPRAILSSRQVYEYAKSRPMEGSPVMRYLEEAELELKCLTFVNFNFVNPEGHNHCEEQGIQQGKGLRLE